MADNEKDKDDLANSEDRFSKILEARWDPNRISRFMKGSQGTRGQGLDMTQRSRFERRLGVDLGNVRIFSGELAEEITRAHGAEALTVGDTGMILMRQSTAFSPGSPDAISRKAVEKDLAAGNVEESEAEAEEHEAEVLAEEMGQPSQNLTAADKGQNERDRRDQIRDRVMELIEEEMFMDDLRMGREVGF
jgi:uncharacterized protein DUF4157